MKDRLDTLRSDLAARLAPAHRFLVTHRFWFGCGAITVFALAAAVAVGSRALDRAEQHRAERRRLERVREGVDRWVAGVQPAMPAESLLWRESEESMRRAVGEGGGGLAVAHRVALRAEEVGIPDVNVRLVEPDSIGDLPLALGDDAAVRVEFEGDWSAVLNFLGVLPPPMTVLELNVSRRGGLLHATALVVGGAEPSSGPDVRTPAARWPEPEELDSLARYLAPVEPAPRIDDYAAFLPAAAPPPRPYEPPAPVREPAPRIDWRVSAILISGDRPLAIVNDQQVRPGEPLPGGARVLSIGRDHVVILESDGTRRTVRLAEGIEGPE